MSFKELFLTVITQPPEVSLNTFFYLCVCFLLYHTIRKCKKMAGQNTFKILLLNDANMSHMSLMHGNPEKLRDEESPRRVVPLSSVVKEPRKSNVNVPEMNLLDKDERCLLYTSPSPRDRTRSRMPSSA